MAVRLRFKEFHHEVGKKIRLKVAGRLYRGVGLNDKKLPKKVIPNGKRLGIHNTAGGVPGRARRASIVAMSSGVKIIFAKARKDEIFNDGVKGPRNAGADARPKVRGKRGRNIKIGKKRYQTPREWVGVDETLADLYADEFVRWLKRDAKRALRRAGR